MSAVHISPYICTQISSVFIKQKGSFLGVTQALSLLKFTTLEISKWELQRHCSMKTKDSTSLSQVKNVQSQCCSLHSSKRVQNQKSRKINWLESGFKGISKNFYVLSTRRRKVCERKKLIAQVFNTTGWFIICCMFNPKRMLNHHMRDAFAD